MIDWTWITGSPPLGYGTIRGEEVGTRGGDTRLYNSETSNIVGVAAASPRTDQRYDRVVLIVFSASMSKTHHNLVSTRKIQVKLFRHVCEILQRHV